MKTQTIQIARITRKGGNRQTFDKEKLKGLAASIETHGLINAIAVHTTAKDRFELIAGERRVKAHELLGRKEIEAKVYTDLTDAELREIRAVENLQREDLTCWEEAEQLTQIKKLNPEARVEDLAAKVGKSATWVAQRLAINKLIAGLRKLVIDQNWPLSHLPLLARLPEPVQADVLERIKRAQTGGNGFSRGHWTDYENGKYVGYVPGLQQLEEFLDQIQGVLSHAPWKLDDAELVPAAGACNVCPKRSSAEALLFPEFEDPKDNRCLDQACWHSKAVALIQLNISKVTTDAGKAPLLLREHWTELDKADLKTFGVKETARVHEFQTCKKTDPKAIAAVHVEGEKAGQIAYVKKPDYSSNGTTKKKSRPVDQDTGKPAAPSTKERLTTLKQKRQCRAVEIWVEGLENLKPEFKGCLDGLVAVFGIEDARTYRDDDGWKDYTANKKRLDKIAWEGLAPVFASRLNRWGPMDKNAEELWQEAEQQATALFELLAWRECWTAAVAEIPLPKTLEREGVKDPAT